MITGKEANVYWGGLGGGQPGRTGALSRRQEGRTGFVASEGWSAGGLGSKERRRRAGLEGDARGSPGLVEGGVFISSVL